MLQADDTAPTFGAVLSLVLDVDVACLKEDAAVSDVVDPLLALGGVCRLFHHLYEDAASSSRRLQEAAMAPIRST